MPISAILEFDASPSLLTEISLLLFGGKNFLTLGPLRLFVSRLRKAYSASFFECSSRPRLSSALDRISVFHLQNFQPSTNSESLKLLQATFVKQICCIGNTSSSLGFTSTRKIRSRPIVFIQKQYATH